MPSGSDRGRRCAESPVSGPDPAGRPDVGQHGAGLGDRQEVRDVLGGRAIAGGEPQRHRLPEQVAHPEEVQREKELLLGEALEPVQPSGRGHHLQARPVALPCAPREPPHRPALRQPDIRHLLHGAGDVRISHTPLSRPPACPPSAQVKCLSVLLSHLISRIQKVGKDARVRRHSPRARSGHALLNPHDSPRRVTASALALARSD
jgi:hypothetical protein